MIIRNSGLDMEDLADVTEHVCHWIRGRGKTDVLVLNLPGEDADVIVKSMDESVLHEDDRIAVKVRLVEGQTAVAEARTEVTLKRT